MKVELSATGEVFGSAGAAPAVLTLASVHVSLGPAAQVEALRNITLAIHAGERVALVGPNGCGKSTLLRTLHGLLPIAQGRREVPHASRIAMLFQRPHMLRMSVRRNLQLGLWLSGVPWGQTKERARQALERVQLASLAERNGRALSGGQQQRVALARALAPRPGLLLLDEPFSNLDTDLRERLSLEVRAILKEAGITAILVTHDQHEAFAIADEIGVMNEGTIEQWASAYDLYHQPRTRFVADFIGQGVFVRGVADARGRLLTELGELDGAPRPELREGDAADVLLRPDDIVHDDASPWRANVVAKTFRGSEFLYTLALASGTRVLAVVPSHHDHAIGEPIGIRLDIDHVVAFPRPDEDAPDPQR